MTRRQISFILGMLGFFLVFCTLDTGPDMGSIVPVLGAQVVGLGCMGLALYLSGAVW